MKKSDIGDLTGHGRTPVTPSNRFPRQLPSKLAAYTSAASARFAGCPETASPLQTRHPAHAVPNIKHIGPKRLWRSRKRVQPSEPREEQEGPRPMKATDVVCCRGEATQHAVALQHRFFLVVIREGHYIQRATSARSAVCSNNATTLSSALTSRTCLGRVPGC